MFVEPKYKTHTTMTTLITLLISLLGYGTPADFSTLTDAELQTQIEMAQADGGLNDWESSGVYAPNPEN